MQDVEREGAVLLVLRHHDDGVQRAPRRDVGQYAANRNAIVGEQQVYAQTQLFQPTLDVLCILAVNKRMQTMFLAWQ